MLWSRFKKAEENKGVDLIGLGGNQKTIQLLLLYVDTLDACTVGMRNSELIPTSHAGMLAWLGYNIIVSLLIGNYKKKKDYISKTAYADHLSKMNKSSS